MTICVFVYKRLRCESPGNLSPALHNPICQNPPCGAYERKSVQHEYKDRPCFKGSVKSQFQLDPVAMAWPAGTAGASWTAWIA
jgi:hypothetical protein